MCHPLTSATQVPPQPHRGPLRSHTSATAADQRLHARRSPASARPGCPNRQIRRSHTCRFPSRGTCVRLAHAESEAPRFGTHRGSWTIRPIQVIEVCRLCLQTQPGAPRRADVRKHPKPKLRTAHLSDVRREPTSGELRPAIAEVVKRVVRTVVFRPSTQVTSSCAASPCSLSKRYRPKGAIPVVTTS
jgi:hypothetical protein